MLWSNRAGPLAAALLALGMLASCGFEPLYARHESGSTVADMAATKIDRIEDRVGQQLRNFLLDRLNPRGRPAKNLYTLSVKLTEIRQDLAIRKDETATRANLIMSATYDLVEIESGDRLLHAISTVTTSFNIVKSDFGTISAENDARRRGVREISDEVRHRLAVYFNGRRKRGS